MENWKIYILECSDGTYYTGVTSKTIEERVKKHNYGTGSKYTRGRRPVKLVISSPLFTKSQAYSLERKIKQLPRNKKVTFVKQLCLNNSISL